MKTKTLSILSFILSISIIASSCDFLSNTDKGYVHKWLPIVAAANLTKQRPEEKEILESWLNVADLM